MDIKKICVSLYRNLKLKDMSIEESVRNQMLKNQYESLIQQMIMDDIPWMTPELRKKIEDAPVEKQREMIISIMEENNAEHRLMFSEIRKMMSNPDRSEMTHIKEVVQMLRKYVKVSEVELTKYGEVMTPIWLVEEMLDTLNGTSVWSNPNLKWLDPCNGVGPFVSVIVERLMKGLQDWEPDNEKRYKHIMEKMIYVCELQAKNMFLYLYAFDPEDKYCLNIYHGSYLDKGFNEYFKSFGITKFDNITMNPPYNQHKDGNKKSSTIWDKFVNKSINDLNEGGYLVSVNPSGWRSVGNGFLSVGDLLRSKQILYLESHNVDDGVKTFGVSTHYDFYCLHNVSVRQNTIIKCMDNTTQRIDISKMKFIPNGMYKEFQMLFPKDNEKTIKVIYDRMAYDHKKTIISKIQSEKYKYPIVYVTYADGSMRLIYSVTNELGHFGIPKIICSYGAGSTPFIDKKGEYGMSEYAFAIVDDVNKLPYIQKALLNPEFLKLMSFVDGNGGRQRYNRNAIALFRKDFWMDFI